MGVAEVVKTLIAVFCVVDQWPLWVVCTVHWSHIWVVSRGSVVAAHPGLAASIVAHALGRVLVAHVPPKLVVLGRSATVVDGYLERRVFLAHPLPLWAVHSRLLRVIRMRASLNQANGAGIDDDDALDHAGEPERILTRSFELATGVPAHALNFTRAATDHARCHARWRPDRRWDSAAATHPVAYGRYGVGLLRVPAAALDAPLSMGSVLLRYRKRDWSMAWAVPQVVLTPPFCAR
mmetsp:Transcript_27932/g.57323  ORF Transcript_27932/g.57323 Transcript_27932/m.57323 type:complete len:236 (+) Transcript_27932:549-1256(+)